MEQWKEYKETEFGKIPNSWDVATIKEETKVVVDYVANGSFASLAENVKYKTEEDYAVLIRLVDYNNNYNGNFVFIDKEAYEFLGKSKLFGDEIIISNVGANVGTVFKCPRLKYKMSLAPNSIMVKFKGNNDFYYYWLKSPFGQHMLHSIVTGSAQPKFNKTNFREMSIPVPPIEIQEKIAQLLKPLDEKIEVNKQINSNLEEQAKALYSKYASLAIGTARIGDLANEVLDYTPCTYPRVYLLNSSDISEGIFPKIELVDNKDLKGHFKKRFRFGDILYSQIRPRNHHYGLVLFEADRYISSTRLMIIRTKKEQISEYLLYQAIISPCVCDEFTLKTETRSGTFPQGNYKDMANIIIPYGTKEQREKIEPKLKVLRKAIYSYQKENVILSSIRDALLPKLMSGEIEVK
jgi:type I restriction enzyme S subunit